MRSSYVVVPMIMWLIATSCSPAQQVNTEIQETDLRFLVIGDWGRKGQFNQLEVANGMGIYATTNEPDFIISTGDNFYPDGVASTQDYQWLASYEQVYENFSLNCPWLVVLGNHDYRGNVEAQIEYSAVSRRWNMPSRYFSQDYMLDQYKVRLIFLDTNPLEDKYYETSSNYKDAVSGQDTTKQLAWMDSLLAEPGFQWKVVVGHHPMYTGGKRKNDPNAMREHLEWRFSKYNVDLYLAGHEHDLQHIKPETPTHHIISGAGSEVRPVEMITTSLFAASTPGFAAVSILKDELRIVFLNQNGENLYVYTLTK